MNFTCNFSFQHYFEVLNYAKKHYAIGPVMNFEKLKKQKKFIILRHDVDFSLERALILAKKEFQHKICSTYFILLHSPFYNALSLENAEIISKISEMGHEIGLHYDTNFLVRSKSINIQIKNEIQILESIINKKIMYVTQHNPLTSKSSTIQNHDGVIDIQKSTIMKVCKYISDSVQNWRSGCMCQHIDKNYNLQILTHPIWWNDKPKNKTQILKTLRQYYIHSLTTHLASINKLYSDYLKEKIKL